MVRIDKTQIPVPAILDTGGQGQSALEQFKTDYDNGIREFKFSSKIYGHKTVKKALKTAQHDKCCFCEAKVSHISHGDVEHFRPKAGFKIQLKTKLTKPGYFWLAYDFSNLYFSCQICNQSFKKNYFPLADEMKRARSHNDDHLNEDCLILDPGDDNPDEHLYFEQEVIKVKNDSLRGTETIKRTGLDRKKLEDKRMDYWLLLNTLAVVARGQSPEATNAKALFKTLGLPQSEFSLLVKSNFPDLV